MRIINFFQNPTFSTKTPGILSPAGLIRLFKKAFCGRRRQFLAVPGVASREAWKISDSEIVGVFKFFIDFKRSLFFTFLLLFSFSLQASIDNWWKNRKAVQFFKDQNYEQALLIYNDLIDTDPYNSEYNYNIGDVLYKQNRHEDALQAFQRAVTHAKKNIKLAEYAWYGAGNSCYQLKKWQQAVEMYEQVLKLNPDNEQARHNLKLAQKKLIEEQLKDMQDKLEKNKENQKDANKDQQTGDDQDSSQDQQNQAGDNSQDSSGSSSDSQSGEKKETQDGKQKPSDKGEKSPSKKDSGTEKENESGKDTTAAKAMADKKSDQKNFDKKDAKSLDEQSGEKGDQEGLEKSVRDDKGTEQDASVEDENGTDFSDMIKKDQQNLDDAESLQAQEESAQIEDEEGKAAKEDQAIDEQQDQLVEVPNEQGSMGAQSNSNDRTPTYKKPELKNQLQDRYEAKSFQDERLDNYYAQIMEALENQEESKQRQVIKNRVAEKMVGQRGKNNW